MVRYTLKILQQMLQDFESVSDRFGTLHIKGLRHPTEKNESLNHTLYKQTSYHKST